MTYIYMMWQLNCNVLAMIKPCLGDIYIYVGVSPKCLTIYYLVLSKIVLIIVYYKN